MSRREAPGSDSARRSGDRHRRRVPHRRRLRGHRRGACGESRKSPKRPWWSSAGRWAARFTMENRRSSPPAFTVEVFNILGAGDGFAAGFLSGWLKGKPLEECARRANACGALVVSRHGCAPAMPSGAELELFLSHGDWPFRLRESTLLEEVHRKTTGRRAWPEVLALAFDHRKQLEELGPRREDPGVQAPDRKSTLVRFLESNVGSHRRRALRRRGALRAHRQGDVARAPGRGARQQAAALRGGRQHRGGACAPGPPSTSSSAFRYPRPKIFPGSRRFMKPASPLAASS